MQQVLDVFHIGDDVVFTEATINRSGGVRLIDSVTKERNLTIRIVGYESNDFHHVTMGELVPENSIVVVDTGIYIPGMTSNWGPLPDRCYYRIRNTKNFEHVGPFSDGLENWI
jgi:hypothetical protein